VVLRRRAAGRIRPAPARPAWARRLGSAPRAKGPLCPCAEARPAISNPGLRDYVHNIVQTGLRDKVFPISYLRCSLLV
jgi:hypothetical protein